MKHATESRQRRLVGARLLECVEVHDRRTASFLLGKYGPTLALVPASMLWKLEDDLNKMLLVEPWETTLKRFTRPEAA